MQRVGLTSNTKWIRSLLVGAIIAACGTVTTFRLEAQTGPNAICVSSSGCSQQSSASFLDASVQGLRGTDFCATIFGILTGLVNKYPSTGTVIDARGLPVQGVSMTCAAGTSPWYENGSFAKIPSTILLPAGIITIPMTWVLPGGTKLIGEGSSSSGVGATQIQACTTNIAGCTSNLSGPMLQFGAPSCPGNECTGIVTGISVEDVLLNGNGLGVIGIQNGWSQELTYVDHVSLYQILGTGLQVNGNATNSGPYTDITFDTGGFAGTTGTVCAQITTVSGTRGIHGLSCTSSGTPSAGVLLDASNNSIQDVFVNGFVDGIRVGENATAHSNVLRNISTSGLGGAMNSLIHICGSGGSCSSSQAVTDLAIIGATTPPFNCPTGQTCFDVSDSIRDDVTGTSLSTQTDDHVGMYVLGRPASGGYSRFTTSPSAATWVLGNPTDKSTPSGSCATGSLYSNISGTPNVPALYVCTVGSPASWNPVK